MPSFNSKVQLSTAAKNTNTVLSDIDRIKGAFKVYTADEMNAAHVNYFTDGQIVYASDSGSLYKASVQLADPGAGIFEDSVSFSEFSFNSGSFNSASFDGGSSTLTFFGQSLVGSEQVSSSVDLSSLSGGGGSGDITSVVAGDGLSGGASTGDATITLDTSSQHFIDAVNELAGDGGIFTTTGSFKSTTNDLQVTGSFSVGDGLFKLTEFTTLPTVEAGAIAYSASTFYFGID